MSATYFAHDFATGQCREMRAGVPVTGSEERHSYRLAGEAYAVHRHTDHVITSIGRVYPTPMKGPHKWQAVHRGVSFGRFGSLKAAALAIYTRERESA